MSDLDFNWQDIRLTARPSGALWCAAARLLIVADLHLGKSERIARRGGALLPPYDGAETLRRLKGEVAALQPAVVVSLGDGFDDDAAATALDPALTAGLAELAQGRDWVWVLGNHDPSPSLTRLPGRTVREGALDGVTLRHAAGKGPDISGHYHPVVTLAGRRMRAFLIGAGHLILPAFGSYTGGLHASDPAISCLVPDGFAIACAHRALALPLTRS